MAFRPGGEYLPFDWVDEGKLLLFIKTQVARRTPCTGQRRAAEKKCKLLERKLEGSTKKKRRKNEAGEGEAPESGDNEPESELYLMYNSVRGYVSAIMELWKLQVSQKLHLSPSPHNVAVKVLKTSIIQGQHAQQHAEFVDCGVTMIKDGYTAKQIPHMTQAVWRKALGPRAVEQAF